MAELSGKNRSEYVRHMFKHLAGRYEIANHWMTWRQDIRWRREVLNRARLPSGGRLLDIGTGTGALAREAIRRDDSIIVVGLDFTQEMMRIGKSRDPGNKIKWLNSEAITLPFNSGSFDAVVSGYLLRNVPDVEQALDEQYRVLKAGGIMVALDTTPPPIDLLHFPVRFYLRYITPIIGGLITGDFEAYRYLPESTNRFLKASDLADCLEKAGYKHVGFRCFMGGCMAIHWGVKWPFH
jgi:demethylmenaquinone methyltransferase/2-methoxy-6-polyprenyl-1,4-benzoquinol methylase